MFTFLKFFFYSLGVIFFFLLCGLTYFWVADPFNIRPLVLEVIAEGGWKNVKGALEEGAITLDRNPSLSATQEAALRSVGIDPEDVPDTITPQMKECFITILGRDRVNDILKGARPTALEVVQTKECYGQ